MKKIQKKSKRKKKTEKVWEKIPALVEVGESRPLNGGVCEGGRPSPDGR